MTTEEFFDELGRRGYEPLMAKATGSVRFEVTQGLCTQHWYLMVDRGVIRVSRDNLEADAVVRMSRDLIDRVTAGTQNIMAALLRGEMMAEGDFALLVLVDRLLPGPQTPTRAQVGHQRGQGGHG